MTAGQSNVSKHKSTTEVAWSPAPPSKKEKKKKTESLLERLKRQKEEKQNLIDMM